MRILKAIWCFLFHRKIKVVFIFNKTTRLLKCERCGQLWGMNDAVQAFLPWDEEFEKHHSEMYPEYVAWKKRSVNRGAK